MKTCSRGREVAGVMFLKTGLRPRWLWAGSLNMRRHFRYGLLYKKCKDLRAFRKKLEVVFSSFSTDIVLYANPFQGYGVSSESLGQVLVIEQLSSKYSYVSQEIDLSSDACILSSRFMGDEALKPWCDCVCDRRLSGMKFPLCATDCICNGVMQQYIRRPECYPMPVLQENC